MMTSMEPGLVSVMMPAYNAERYIGRAIESLLRQRYAQWELIVINDGSTDQTAMLARTFADVRIRVVDQENAGEASARNAALSQMRGEFVAFLDADDAFLPQHLESAAGFLAVNRDYHAVYSDGLHCDEEDSLLPSLSSRRLLPRDGNIFSDTVRASSMLGPPVCVVLRRAVILDQDLWFDPAITIGPDWDFFIRYSEQTRFHYLDKKTCLYRLHQNNLSLTTAAARRFADLARCRSKAIRLTRFATCELGVRTAVFYDLLVNLLLSRPAEQTEIVSAPEFKALPAAEQARLLRLMASKAILYAEQPEQVSEWFDQALALNRWDGRALLLSSLWRLSPALLRRLLRLRTRGQTDPRLLDPFADVVRDTVDFGQRALGAAK